MLWRKRDPERPPRVAFGIYKRAIVGMFVIIVATGAAGATAALLKVDDFVHILREGHQINFSPQLVTKAQAGQPQTILVLGSDLRRAEFAAGLRQHKYNTRGESDTIMLIHMDPNAEATTVMSIPRDLYVNIPRFGMSKINAAYSDGGATLTLKTIEALLPGLQINHVINVGFDGFSRAVNFLHGVYVQVDRRYYNVNDGTAAHDYSAINLEPGYQKLHGQDALSFVRYRHTDSTFVRDARQQDFVREVKEQESGLITISKLEPLAKTVARSIQTDHDIATEAGLLRLLKLGAYVANKPVQQIKFSPTGDSTINAGGTQEDIVTYDPANMPALVDRFEHPVNLKKTTTKISVGSTSHHTTKHHKKKHTHHGAAPVPPGYVDALSDAQSLTASVLAHNKVSFPLYAPRLLPAGMEYTAPGADPPDAPNPYAYTLYDRNVDKTHRQGHPHSAYVMVVTDNPVQGEYFDIQGTDWMNPPLLANPSETQTVSGRKLEFFTSGGHLTYVAWKTPHAVYWVSNTLTNDLTNRQMITIASSLMKPYG